MLAASFDNNLSQRHLPKSLLGHVSFITETNRIQLVLFAVQNMTFGPIFAVVAGRRHALLRRHGNAPGPHHQPARLPFANDDWHAGGEPGVEGGRWAAGLLL
jgi:hypothetical protein